MSSPNQLTSELESRSDLTRQVVESAAALEQSQSQLRDQSRILKSVLDSMAEG